MALSAGIAAALTMPTGATAAPSFGATEAAPATVDIASPEMLTAMQRDFGISASEALDRLARDAAASQTEEDLRSTLGATFGGAWISDNGLVVAVTDASQAAEVRAAGATPRLVAHSEAALDEVMTDLDGLAAPASTEVYGWHVDVATNSVVVQAAPGAEDSAAAWVEESGVDAAAVRIDTTTEAPELLYNVRGGDAYYIGSGRCSVGFSVQPRGFVTAGHCGRVGNSTTGFNRVAQGSFQRSNFPGADMAYVAVNSNWVPRPWVNRYSGTFLVSGSQVAAIGAATCRSGSTTGWRCGNITHRNQTVNYAQGAVYGLTRTTACAQPGDSGGSFVANGGQAQGVTSGGSGNCSSGGVTFFQPLNPILSNYGLSLVRG